MADLSVNIAGVEWKNPVTTGSGTFGFGREYAEYFDLSNIGAICLKAISTKPRLGNKSPRIAEVTKGMLNSVGLQNPGAEYFLENELPWLRQFDTKLIANLCGSTIEDYVEVAEILANKLDMFELNISCPNVKEGGMAFGTDAKMIEEITSKVKAVSKVPLIVKLSPNVTDIAEMINKLLGMKIDINTRRPVLNNNMGGMSGPAVMPVAVRMVYQVRRAVKLPIIGMGGITTGEDAVEFLLAGADAVSVGTAGIVDPYAWIKVRNGINDYLDKNGYESVNDIVGKLEMNN